MIKDKILLVEDDSTLSFIVQDALIREGFDVVCAPNGESGLKLFKESNPDSVHKCPCFDNFIRMTEQFINYYGFGMRQFYCFGTHDKTLGCEVE